MGNTQESWWGLQKRGPHSTVKWENKNSLELEFKFPLCDDGGSATPIVESPHTATDKILS